MTVAMTGRQLAHGALWANGATLQQCAEIMGVGIATVHSMRRSIRRKYAVEGITIVNGVHAGRVLVEHPPIIKPQRRPSAYLPEPSRHRRRPSTITPERLVIVQQLRAEGLSFARIAEQLGVGPAAVSRAFARAEREAALAPKILKPKRGSP